MDERHPLMERLNFLLIFSSNLDEYFEIRVAGLRALAESGASPLAPDARPAAELLSDISQICHEAVARQYDIFNQVLLPALAEQQVRFLRRDDWSEAQSAWEIGRAHV